MTRKPLLPTRQSASPPFLSLWNCAGFFKTFAAWKKILLMLSFVAVGSLLRNSTQLVKQFPYYYYYHHYLENDNQNSRIIIQENDTTLLLADITGWVRNKLQQQNNNQQPPPNDNSGNPQKRTVYSMKRWTSYNMTFSQATPCNLGVSTNKWGRKPKWREPLLESLQPLLNFTTTIRTSFNILVMGDSVAVQLGQLLEEAMGVTSSSPRALIDESWPGHEGLTISTSTSARQSGGGGGGGGSIANYRITGMFLAKGEGKPLPNAAGGGWNRTHAQVLLQHPYLQKYTSNNNNNNGFDVVIFRIPHGWLKFSEINEHNIRETIQLAHDIFGVRHVILIDIPFTNNIKTLQDIQDKTHTNNLLQQIAESYRSTNNKGEGVDTVTVLQFARWTDHLMEYNARAIGIIPPSQQHSVISNKSYALDRLGCSPKFPLSIAHGCANYVNPGSCTCRRNRITEDGIHWCLESIGGRFVAGIACLLSCLGTADSTLGSNSFEDLRKCETQCNDRFMSLQALDFQDGEVFG